MSGEEVKIILNQKGIKLASLARMMKISAQNLHGILRAKDISSTRLDEISNFTGIDFRSGSYQDQGDANILNDMPKTYKNTRNLDDVTEIDYLKRLVSAQEEIIKILKEKCGDKETKAKDQPKSKAS